MHTSVAASLCNTIVDCACAGVQGPLLNFCSAIGLMLGDLPYMKFCDCCKKARDNKYKYLGALHLTTRIMEAIDAIIIAKVYHEIFKLHRPSSSTMKRDLLVKYV